MGRKNHHKRDTCYYCEREFTFKNFGEGNAVIKTIDHIIPKNKGGVDKYINTVYSCKHCNNLKGNLSLYEFLKKIESLIAEDYSPSLFPKISLYKISEKTQQLKQYVERQGEKLYKVPTT